LNIPGVYGYNFPDLDKDQQLWSRVKEEEFHASQLAKHKFTINKDAIDFFTSHSSYPSITCIYLRDREQPIYSFSTYDELLKELKK